MEVRKQLAVGVAAAFGVGCPGHPRSVVPPAPVRAALADAPKPTCTQLAPVFRPLIEGRWVKSASLALLKDGRSLLCSFGRTGNAGSSLASPDTLYEIGSLTKLFTGLLLAEQSERGAVRLDDPVSQLLPAPLRSAGRPITLLDLATQRSGLPRLPSNLAPRDPQNPYADYDAAQLLAFLRGVEPAPAGAQYQYSNVGAALLGDALSRRARKSYPALVREHLLTPLDMTDTHFAVPPGKERRLARGHDVDDAPRPAWDVDVFAPAVGLRKSFQVAMGGA
jgi:serine-type D-Ala-D-Ala carboxypeptidase/endopeptidase